MNLEEVKILLVEDNEGDIVLTFIALKEAHIKNQIIVLKDGQEAIEYLKKEGKYKDANQPDLVLLDINLPKVNGLEVLSEIKKDRRLDTIPVAMLTSSSSEKDISISFQNHADFFIPKPLDTHKLEYIFNSIKDSKPKTMQLYG